MNKPRGSERNDQDASGVHFALHDYGKLMAIARLDRAGDHIAQVRFVAVEENSRGKGYGRMIMKATEESALSRGDERLFG